MKQEELAIIKSLLQKDFEYEAISSSFSEFQLNLTSYIQYLLNNDFGKLLQGLYRIDVNEEKVKEILNLESPEKLAPSLAILIIERLQQKAITRLQYR